jgi:hypothetical protein
MLTGPVLQFIQFVSGLQCEYGRDAEWTGVAVIPICTSIGLQCEYTVGVMHEWTGVAVTLICMRLQCEYRSDTKRTGVAVILICMRFTV